MAANLMFDAFICVGTFFFFISGVSGNFGAPGQPRQQLLCSRSSSLATLVLPATSPASNFCDPGNLASNFGALQQIGRSRSTSPPTSSLTSPATSPLPVRLVSNFGAPGQPRQQLRRARSTSPATSVLFVNPTSNFGTPGCFFFSSLV